MSNFFHSNGTRYTDITFRDSDIKMIAENWRNHANAIPDYPCNFEGKGIVICAGGINYFTCCWVLVNILRREQKCTLPIQVWYVGNELTQGAINALREIDVRCYNFLDYEKNIELKGWMLKPLAIKLSSFKEVLYLDADNIPAVNPEFLFQTPEYEDSGAVFWPDFWETDSNNQIWEIIGCKSVPMKEQESGQLLINKEKCWKELNLAVYFNRNSNIYYSLLLGDKDTFRFAWLALKSNFYFISHEVASCGQVDFDGMFLGNTMVQHTPDGRMCFLHRNLLKWHLTRPGKATWTTIKSFKKNAIYKQYMLLKLSNGLCMNLEGDVEMFIFQHLFGCIESQCLEYLCDLRASKLYNDFALSSYKID